MSTGIALIFIGGIILFISILKKSKEKEKKAKARVGGVLFIGPIPILYGSDKDMAIIALVLGILMIILTFFIFYGFRIYKGI